MARASGNPIVILAEQFLRPLDLEEVVAIYHFQDFVIEN